MNFQKNLYYDNKAMKEVQDFIELNPGCTYEEATFHIRWYWDLPLECFSPWIADWIIGCMESSKGKNKI